MYWLFVQMICRSRCRRLNSELSGLEGNLIQIKLKTPQKRIRSSKILMRLTLTHLRLNASNYWKVLWWVALRGCLQRKILIDLNQSLLTGLTNATFQSIRRPRLYKKTLRWERGAWNCSDQRPSNRRSSARNYFRVCWMQIRTTRSTCFQRTQPQISTVKSSTWATQRNKTPCLKLKRTSKRNK